MPRFSRLRRRSAASALLLAALFAAEPAAAQSPPPSSSDTASLPFRAGQWGAEFGLGSYTSAGFVRFRAPSRAWVGTVSGDYTRQTPEGNLPDRTSSQLDVTAGHRWFRAVLPNVSQFVTLGGVLGSRRFEATSRQSTFPDPGTVEVRSTRTSYFAGVVADVGAQWMVTPSLSLGAKWGAQAVVGRDRERFRGSPSSTTDLTGTSTSLFLGRIAVLGTLYF